MLKSIKYNGLNIKGNILSAPMAGYSNFPSRMVFQEYGADLTFTEMISARGIVRGDKKTIDLLYTNDNEISKAVQIFDDDKYIIKDAIDYIQERTTYNIVNLNAGCPMKKILKSNKGGALLRDIEKLKEILTYLSNRIKINLTLKIRSGWDKNNLNYLYVGKLAEDNNCKMIIFHPRTVKQIFSGKADWNLIYNLKKHVQIPVIGNGDIFSPENALDRFKADEIDGIMIARGSIGNPWIFKNIKQYINKGKYVIPDTKKKIKIMMKHLKKIADFFGERRGIMLFRTQMFQYLKHFENSAIIRKKIQDQVTIGNIKKILSEHNLF